MGRICFAYELHFGSQQRFKFSSTLWSWRAAVTLAWPSREDCFNWFALLGPYKVSIVNKEADVYSGNVGLTWINWSMLFVCPVPALLHRFKCTFIGQQDIISTKSGGDSGLMHGLLAARTAEALNLLFTLLTLSPTISYYCHLGLNSSNIAVMAVLQAPTSILTIVLSTPVRSRSMWCAHLRSLKPPESTLH